VPAKIQTPIAFADFSVKAMGDAGSSAFWQAQGNIAYARGANGVLFRAVVLATPHLPIYSTKGMTDSKDKNTPSLLLQEVDTGNNRACPSFLRRSSSTCARS